MVSISAARRAGVPLLVIETADPAQTMGSIARDLANNKDAIPLLRWDICRCLVGINPGGQKLARTIGADNPIATQNPSECLGLLTKVTTPAIVFFMNAHMFWGNETVKQGIWNLRDLWKSREAMLIMLCPVAVVPAELKNDVVVINDTLPTVDEVARVVDIITKDAGLKPAQIGDKDKICDTLLGLPEFAAEQVLAMSISPEGVDAVGLWERKRKMIEQTPGLSVWRGGETFAGVGGYNNAKTFMRDICLGRKAPRAVVYIDEIEKSMAGAGTDTSGVSQDQLRALLTYMQDKKVQGCIFIGPPGSGKSAVAKATGNEANVPTINLDLGGMKGSLVGQSEERLRTALNVIEAVSQGRSLFIATCNSIGILPPELRRRFSLGTFFFPLPSAEDRAAIWKIYMAKYELDCPLPDDEGWTGAEIENCCMIAWMLKRTLVEAARFVVPVSISAQDQINKLCNEAHRRYVSASSPGLYENTSSTEPATPAGRKVKVR
jgi:hypothetical protein